MPSVPNRGFLIRNRNQGTPPWRLVVDIAGRDRAFEGHPAPDRDVETFAVLTDQGTTTPTRGYIGVNQRKTKDTQPDIRGRVRVEGTEWDVAAWLKNGKADTWSVRVNPPRTTTPAPGDAARVPPEDDVPLSNQDFIDIFAQNG